MSNSEKIACLETETAVKRIEAKCEEIRAEFAASERNIREVMSSVKREGFNPTA